MGANRLLLYVLVLIFFFPLISADIVINEIMANTNDDAYNEWVEIYNNGAEEVDISGWSIGDQYENDSLISDENITQIPPNSFAIITDSVTKVYENFNVSGNALRLHVDAAIGNGLKNSGESLYLFDKNKNLVFSAAYPETTKGKSFSFIDDGWVETEPTPGYENAFEQQTLIPTKCDWKIEAILNNTEFKKDDFSFKIKISKLEGDSANLSAKIAIEDSKGNTIREYNLEDSASYQKTAEYSPNINSGEYILKSNLKVSCDDFNSGNDNNEKNFKIIGELFNESEIEISGIYGLKNDKAKFGDQIKVKLNVYRGNTDKKYILLWIEDNNENKISEVFKKELAKTNKKYVLEIPLNITDNCDNRHYFGDYYVTAYGFDKEDKEEIFIENASSCKINDSRKRKPDFILIDYPKEINLSKEFNIEVRIKNNEGLANFSLRSYVYRGNKVYSDDNKKNKINFSLMYNEEIIAELTDNITEAESGDYKLKVLLNKNNQKTNYALTKNISISNSTVKKKNMSKNLTDYDKKEKKNKKTEYESKQEKNKMIIPIMIIFITTLLSVILIWKR